MPVARKPMSADLRPDAGGRRAVASLYDVSCYSELPIYLAIKRQALLPTITIRAYCYDQCQAMPIGQFQGRKCEPGSRSSGRERSRDFAGEQSPRVPQRVQPRYRSEPRERLLLKTFANLPKEMVHGMPYGD